VLAPQLDDVHLAINERAPAPPSCLFAILFGQLAVLGGQHTLLGSLPALSHAALALLCGAHDDLGSGERPHAILSRIADAHLRHRDIARDRGLVSRERCDIAVVRDHVALLAGLQSRLGAVIALACGVVALIGATRTDVLADVVLFAVTAGGEVLIAGSLIVVGRQLVAISTGLITVSVSLIGI